MAFPQFLKNLGYPKCFGCVEELIADGWYRLLPTDTIQVGDFIAPYKEYRVYSGTVFDSTSNYLGKPCNHWPMDQYEFFRLGKPGPRKLPLNKHFSEPLPLP